MAAPRTKTARSPLHLADRKLLLVFGDLLVLSLSLGLSLRLNLLGFGPLLSDHISLQLTWWVILVALWLVLANAVKLFDLSLAAQPAKSAATASLMALVVCAIYLVIPVWSAPLTRSRFSWFIFVALSALGETVWRRTYGTLLHGGQYCRNVVVYGDSNTARELVALLQERELRACTSVLGYIGACQVLEDITPWLGAPSDLAGLLDSLPVDDLVVACENRRSLPKEERDALVACWQRGIQVLPLIDYCELVCAFVPVRWLGADLFALVHTVHSVYESLWQAARRVIDVIAAGTLLLLFALALPFIAAVIWLDCPGPIFYRQQRVGQGGKVFTITKLRSMIPNAEQAGRAVWAKKGDDRITRIGRMLRKTRLDELPQLWNVLTGDMSLIGPRPERPEFVQQLEQELPYYGVRHAVRPGLTGWAQVRYRYGNSVEDALIKLQYDLYYIKHRGPLLDALIVLHTIRTVLRMEGA
jgi:exopolysaccharide biosynthesis polyprenyl glycosylphosphotransferase